jgi:hypothetical protein
MEQVCLNKIKITKMVATETEWIKILTQSARILGKED